MALFNFNSVNTQIKELRTFIATVKTAGANAEYNAVRAEFNLRAASALVGIGFKENEDGTWTSTGWSPLPNKNQTIEIQVLIDDFITNIEPNFKCNNVNIDDDMQIISPSGRFVQYDDNINNSKFKEIIIKALTKKLCKEDFLTLARLAEKLRMHNYKMVAYWALGITFAIGAGVGLYTYRKNKEQEAKKGETSTTEYDDVGSDVVITVDDDMPVVIISDDIDEVTVLD